MNRDFKGVWISKEIWTCKGLSLQEKVFIVEIDSLDNQDGCYASNAYFGEFFQLSKGRVSQIINGLKERNLISISYIYKEGSNEISVRIIRINHPELDEILKETTPSGGIKDSKEVGRILKGVGNILKGGYVENDTYNNPLENNKIDKKLSKDNYPRPGIIPTIEKKTSKAKEMATMKSMINAFSQDDDVRDKLREYLDLRIKKGLKENQWAIILEDLKKFAKDDSELIIEKINNAIAGGYMQIIAAWEKGKAKSSRYEKPHFDNTRGKDIGKAAKDMTDEEFNETLARDKDGNLLEF